MKEFSKEYIERLNTMIEQHDTEAISTELKDMHPADIAELVNDLHDDEALYVMRMLDDETAADVIVELDEDRRHDLLELIPNETIARQVEQRQSLPLEECQGEPEPQAKVDTEKQVADRLALQEALELLSEKDRNIVLLSLSRIFSGRT